MLALERSRIASRVHSRCAPVTVPAEAFREKPGLTTDPWGPIFWNMERDYLGEQDEVETVSEYIL